MIANLHLFNSYQQEEPEEAAKTLALAKLMLKHNKRKDIIDGAYNRWAFDDQDLPEWFEDDQRQYNRPQLPITKEMIEEMKKRFEPVSKKAIGKVVEARARKKQRLMKKMEAAKKKASSIFDNPELNEREKTKVQKSILSIAG